MLEGSSVYRLSFKKDPAFFSVFWHFMLDHIFVIYRILAKTGDLGKDPQFYIEDVVAGENDNLLSFYNIFSKRELRVNETGSDLKIDYDLGQVLGSGCWEDKDSLTYLHRSEEPKILNGNNIDLKDCYINFRKRDVCISDDFCRFKKYIYEKFDIKNAPLHCTIIKRRYRDNEDRENRVWLNLDEFKANLIELGLPIREIYLEDYSPQEQLQLMSETKILISPMGSSSTLSAFLPDESLLVLILPHNFYYPLSRILSDHARIKFYGVSPTYGILSSNTSDDELNRRMGAFENQLKDVSQFCNLLNKDLTINIETVMQCCQEYLELFPVKK